MAPAAGSSSGKRRYLYDDRSTPIKRLSTFMSPDPTEHDAQELNEVVHDGSKEPYPQRPAYDIALYNLLNKNQKLVKQLLNVIDQHAHISKELQNMQTKAREAVRLPTPDRVMVALVGGTGAGKESESFIATLC